MLELAHKQFRQSQTWEQDLVGNLANTELSRDLNLFRKLFNPIWADINTEPNFDNFDNFERAYLLRYAGSFLCHFGRAKSLVDFQERGKDLLSQASEQFFRVGLIDEYYESQIILAYSYYYESRGTEFAAILESVECFYEANHQHKNYLLAKVNHLEWLKDNDLTEAVKCINQIQSLIKKCSESKIKCQFHTQTGIVFRRVKRFDDSLFHFEQGIFYAKEIENQRFLANLLNSLGNLYRSWDKRELAHLKVDEALDIAKRLGDVGWQANYLDTKANIYFDQKKYDLALEIINKAILFFPEGDDYAGYADALWLKARIYFKQDLRELGFDLFFKIIEIASQRLGERSVYKYLSQLADLAYFPAGESYKEQVVNFRRYLIETALVKANGNSAEAARELQMLPATMSDNLRNQFPDLQRDLTMEKERHPRTKKETVKVKSDEITSYILNKKEVEFPIKFSDKPYYFHLPKEKTDKIFKFNEEIVIAVIPVDAITKGDLFLFRDEKISVGEVKYNETWQILDYYSDKTLQLSEIKLYGKLVGHTPTEFLKNEKVVFYGFKG